ncbi:winged helix-turn-helix transcriptional regulator [Cyanobacterium stanieri LEGE 03274]|uniref:Winged helix-turn-helix transcriptional regulator n=1 Tax=Cyanobacterium stanieri LEGE 03274 TaxID=1828756 RepID=A0ABR9V278_9CHRO|nr:metalloregulator ArsR/SmtB family transcription factor [Cyanobacterium stanieri]MBE9221988.1 winged helix-turn-helix transcriptional regulator [Cyanobacterium stanieri LEGE 03274]
MSNLTEEKTSAVVASECLMAKMSPSALGLVADFFKVLSESSRLNIVCALRSGEKNVSEIIDITELGQANVSKHLKILAGAGVVTRTQKGINVYYKISNAFVFELCDLVCNSLSIQIEQQNKHLQHLRAMQQTIEN